jgi:hypothetical protein
MLGCALLCVLITFQLARAQGTPAVFDGGAVESATTISGGVCSNPVIGISYQLPEGMQPEDATRMREVAALGARANLGIGPEARYFLYGYQEATTIALLCGAASQAGSVQMLASPASIIMAQGPNALERVVSSLAQEAHVQPSPPRVKTVNGLKLECADFHTEVSAPGRGKIEIRGSSCAAVVNSYVVMWNLIGYSEAEWNQLVAGLDSVKVFTAQPLKPPPPPGPSSPSSPQAPVAPDFQARLDAFLKAWLADRNVGKTMSFFDRAAYSAPPFVGTYCGGWYKRDAPAQVAARFMSHNLMGVPSEFPQQTGAPAIFKAWNRLPAPWVREAANDVAKDHFLVARLDSDSLPRIFSGIFTRSDYRKFLESQIQKPGSAYWVVFPELMPDGDLFVIFTLWQKSGGPWKITHMDVICQ